MRPIFLFSLPRSGSTLLQRILGNHPKISTVSEPWILLPFVGAINPLGTYAEYSHKNSSAAIREFINHLPGGENDFYEETHSYILNLYKKICRDQKGNATYFLDKTPRYHLIIDKIHRIFPEAKFIFLMRNPLAVVSSMLLTKPKNIWSLYFFNIDLYNGLENLVFFFNKYSSFSIKIKYEDLLNNPTTTLKKIFEYLEIDDENFAINLSSNQFLAGRMGDQILPSKENQFNLDSLNKWKTVLNNPVRRKWSRHYIRWIGNKRLNEMGYNMDELIDSIDNMDVSIDLRSINDIYRIIFGVFYSIFEFTILKNNLKNISRYFKIGAKT